MGINDTEKITSFFTSNSSSAKLKYIYLFSPSVFNRYPNNPSVIFEFISI